MPARPIPRLAVAVLGLAAALAVSAQENLSRGQVLYVPVYSEVPHGDRGFTLNLTATLSLRNTDRGSPITVRRVDYFSAAGTLVRAYLKQPVPLKPLASGEYIVKESDRSGGISASFLVEWDSPVPVSAPVVEAVMVHGNYNQGLAFTSPARVLEEKR
jgi:hypothetical protein